MWQGTVKIHNFHKNLWTDPWKDFEMEGGMHKCCVVTKEDQKMANILVFNTNSIFPESKFKLDMLGAITPTDTYKVTYSQWDPSPPSTQWLHVQQKPLRNLQNG